MEEESGGLRDLARGLRAGTGTGEGGTGEPAGVGLILPEARGAPGSEGRALSRARSLGGAQRAGAVQVPRRMGV